MKRLFPFLLLLCSVPSWAALAIDAQTTSAEHASLNCATGTIASASTTTTAANEPVFAFIQINVNSTSTPSVASISGAGLTWVNVVKKSVAVTGDVEIWRAFATTTFSAQTITATMNGTAGTCSAVMSVVSFTGADTTGTNGSGAVGATNSCASTSGTPTCSLTTTRNASWVFGSLFNFTNSTAPTATSGQTVFGNVAGSTGEYYWSQRQTATTATSGTSVPISDSAPTAINYTMVIMEVLPPSSGVTKVCTIALMGAGPC